MHSSCLIPLLLVSLGRALPLSQIDTATTSNSMPPPRVLATNGHDPAPRDVAFPFSLVGGPSSPPPADDSETPATPADSQDTSPSESTTMNEARDHVPLPMQASSPNTLSQRQIQQIRRAMFRSSPRSPTPSARALSIPRLSRRQATALPISAPEPPAAPPSAPATRDLEAPAPPAFPVSDTATSSPASRDLEAPALPISAPNAPAPRDFESPVPPAVPFTVPAPRDIEAPALPVPASAPSSDALAARALHARLHAPDYNSAGPQASDEDTKDSQPADDTKATSDETAAETDSSSQSSQGEEEQTTGEKDSKDVTARGFGRTPEWEVTGVRERAFQRYTSLVETDAQPGSNAETFDKGAQGSRFSDRGNLARQVTVQ